MHEMDIKVASNLINYYQQNKKPVIDNFCAIILDITQTYINYRTSSESDFIKSAHNLICNIQDIREKSLIKNQQTSCDFNVLSLFQIAETQHSILLSHLLNPNSNHGQGHLFLNVFLDLLQICRLSDTENWIVTAEKGRIDILLKRVQPHSVIVIENKSNYAIDQDHQLYRYWYQEIYKTILERHLPTDYIINPPECYYQLLYLSPTQWKVPGDSTLTKPVGWQDDLPRNIPLKVKHLLFNEFICQWLQASLLLLPENNHRIIEYIKQYLEYWSK